MFLAFHAVRRFPSLADSNGDNDSLLRLVQVRDLLAGQGWFDLTQYRMGLDGGFVMHWSRLIDLPVAVLVTVFGEPAALVIWPLLFFALSLFFILRTARLIGGTRAVLPAVVTGALALHFVNVFLPGALDHHNVQLALALGAAYALMAGLHGSGVGLDAAGAASGLCAALMLAIGMEAAPYAAAACAVAAFCYLAGGETRLRLARGFGTSFAVVALASFVATIAPGQWLAVHCDAFSIPQAALAVLGGGGLALAASLPVIGRSAGLRLLVLAGLGLLVTVLAVAAFPQCLSDPYADLDPTLRQYWLNAVAEARSLPALIRSGDSGTMAGYYATPVIALIVLMIEALRGRLSREAAVLSVFLVVAVAVSLWQVRGGIFSVPLAAIVLSAWIGRMRAAAETDATARAQIAMIASWVCSISLVWQAAAVMLDRPATTVANGDTKAVASDCYAFVDYEGLAVLPAGTVLTISNLGSSVLRQTPHRVLNGPYHRNNAGNRAALDILMGDPATAHAAIRALGVDYVAVCPGNPETRALAGWAPDGFLHDLAEGSVPAWLQPVAESEAAPLRVFAVMR